MLPLLSTSTVVRHKKLSYVLSLTHTQRYFAQTIDDLGRSIVTPDRIDTDDHLPANMKPYRLPPGSREEVHKQIQCLMRNGIVREFRSPWPVQSFLPINLTERSVFVSTTDDSTPAQKGTVIVSLASMIVLISYRKRNTLQVLILCPATGKFL